MDVFKVQFSSINGRMPYPVMIDEKGKALKNAWGIDAVLGVSNHPYAENIDIDFNELCRDVEAARGRYLVAVSNGEIVTCQQAIKEMNVHKIKKGTK